MNDVYIVIKVSYLEDNVGERLLAGDETGIGDLFDGIQGQEEVGRLFLRVEEGEDGRVVLQGKIKRIE